MALTNGVYAIVAYLNPNCCTDNSYFSTQALNPQFLCGYAGSANQKMIVRTAESGVADENSVKIQQSGQYWYINCVAGMDNQVLKQYPKGQGAQNKELSWYFEDTGDTLEVNGNDLPVYLIKSGANRSYAINYKDSLASYLNALKITTITDSTKKYQQFVPIKTTQYDQNMVAPTIKIDGEINNVVSAKLNTPTAKTIRFSTGSKFQYRVRRAFLLHNTSTWAEDELYYSPTNQTTDYGYGDVWTNNAVATNTYTMESANNSPTLWSEPYDSVRYTIECRQYSSNGYGAIGGVVNTKTYTTSQKLNVDIDNVVVSAEGLVVKLSTDAYRTIDGGNISVDLLVNGKSILYKRYETTLKLSSTAIIIGYENLSKMLEIGDRVLVSTKFSSSSQYIESFNYSKTVDVDVEGGELEPKLSITDSGDNNIHIVVSESAGQSFNYVNLAFIYTHDGNTVIRKIIDGKDVKNADFCPPLNNDYMLYAFIAKKNSAGEIEQWGTTVVSSIKQSNAIAVFNSTNAELAVNFSLDGMLCFSNKKEITSDEVEFNGSQYKDLYERDSKPSPLSFSDIYVLYEEIKSLEQIIDDFYFLVRTNTGQYINVAIKNISYSKYLKHGVTLSLELEETNRDLDITIPS